MRGTLYNWTVGFFYPAATSASEQENKTLTISPAFYLTQKINGQGYHDYLAEKKFLTDGYTRIQFNNFDFRNDALQPLLEILHPSFLFVQAEFTVEQVCALINNGFDLSKSYYRTVGSNSPMMIDDYLPLYYFCVAYSFQKSLHGVAVHFNEESDISCFPYDFASVCNATSFYDVILSQAQFDFLLANRIEKSIDLSGISLINININHLINENHERIFFYKEPFSRGAKKICLAETSIRESIIETETIALLATHPKFHGWFSENALTFTVRHCDRSAFTFIDYKINVDSFVRKLELTTPIKDSPRNKTPRFYAPNEFYILLADTVKKQGLNNVDLALKEEDKGITLMWVIYCVVHIPSSSIAKSFWNGLGVKKSEWASEEVTQKYLSVV
ncbi:MAG: hypothetical protein NTU49_11050 [Gammaproteobacteria bacterium]|nr:hypothetical protein [Gammaproteobacteria bacterium]